MLALGLPIVAASTGITLIISYFAVIWAGLPIFFLGLFSDNPSLPGKIESEVTRMAWVISGLVSIVVLVVGARIVTLAAGLGRATANTRMHRGGRSRMHQRSDLAGEQTVQSES